MNLPINGEVLKFDANSGEFLGKLVPSSDPHAPFGPRGVIAVGSMLLVADVGNFDNVHPGQVLRYNLADGSYLGKIDTTGFDKLFAPLGDKPVIAHTIDAFERTSCVDEIILVGRSDSLPELRKLLGAKTKVHQVIAGGLERQDSVRIGLDHLDAKADFVAVHDAARPLITPEKISRVFEICRQHGAAALAELVTDTLKRADVDLIVTESVDRDQLYAMQTPQIFSRDLLVKAYQAVAEKNISVSAWTPSLISVIRGRRLSSWMMPLRIILRL